jgi:hypothetical protein
MPESAVEEQVSAPAVVEEVAEQVQPEVAEPVVAEVDPRSVQGRELLDLLENPDTSQETLQLLAARLGFTAVQKGATPAVARKSVRDIFKSALGANYAQFGDVFGPAVEEAIKAGITAETETLRAELRTSQENSAAREATSTVTSFQKEFSISDATLKLMNTQAEKTPMGAGYRGDLKAYLTDIHKIVKGSLTENSAVVKAVNKINRNSSESVPTPTEVNESRVKIGSKLPTLAEALAAALDGKRFE